MRAAIYARVSSAAQRDADTIASQLRVLRTYVAGQGWTLTDEYIDDGKSAKTGQLEKRDAFTRLVRDADAHLFDVLVVIDIDRLTRTGDISERAQILSPFQRNGIDIVTPSGGRQDLRTMLGELYVTMHALFAAEENRKRSERTMRGKLEAARRGRSSTGRPPYGLCFDRETGEWAHDVARAPIVREIVERVAAGEACYSIAADLDARGVSPPGSSAMWQRNRAWDIVTSRHVIGEVTVNKEHRLVVKVPPIVDVELWEAAQVELRRHKRRGLRRSRHVYLLEGIATCGVCGARMLIRSASNNRIRTYVCGNRLRKTRRSACPSPPVRIDEIDQLVWEQIEGALRAPDLDEVLAEERDSRALNARDWAADAKAYRAHLSRLESTETAVLTRFRRGSISEPALDTELAAIQRERAAVGAQLETAQQAAATEADTAVRLGTIADAARAALPADRRALVLALVDGAVIFYGFEAHFDLIVPRASGAIVTGESTCSGRQDGVRIQLVAGYR